MNELFSMMARGNFITSKLFCVTFKPIQTHNFARHTAATISGIWSIRNSTFNMILCIWFTVSNNKKYTITCVFIEYVNCVFKIIRMKLMRLTHERDSSMSLSSLSLSQCIITLAMVNAPWFWYRLDFAPWWIRCFGYHNNNSSRRRNLYANATNEVNPCDCQSLLCCRVASFMNNLSCGVIAPVSFKIVYMINLANWWGCAKANIGERSVAVGFTNSHTRTRTQSSLSTYDEKCYSARNINIITVDNLICVNCKRYSANWL